MNPAVRDRIDDLRRENVSLEIMETQTTSAVVDELRRLFPRTPLGLTRILDASDMPREAVIDWLTRLPLPADQHVVVVWPHYGAGVSLRYDDFANHYDDLWYPGADDVWVMDDSKSWLLDLSHEEKFVFFPRPQSDA